MSGPIHFMLSVFFVLFVQLSNRGHSSLDNLSKSITETFVREINNKYSSFFSANDGIKTLAELGTGDFRTTEESIRMFPFRGIQWSVYVLTASEAIDRKRIRLMRSSIFVYISRWSSCFAAPTCTRRLATETKQGLKLWKDLIFGTKPRPTSCLIFGLGFFFWLFTYFGHIWTLDILSYVYGHQTCPNPYTNNSKKKKKTKLLPCLMVITSISRLYPMEKNTGPTMWTSNSQQHILPRWPIATSTSTSIVFHSKGTLIA